MKFSVSSSDLLKHLQLAGGAIASNPVLPILEDFLFSIANNLAFTLDREPDNARAETLLAEVEHQDPNAPLVSDLALEKEINTFFRLHSPSVIARLREAFPDLPERPDPKTVFLKLRELRNQW